MNVIAIYSVNQHLSDLHEEARRNRLASQVERGPSLLRRVIAAVRSAFTANASDPTPAPAGS